MLRKCKCVVQVSAVCPGYDSKETGAATYEERMEAIKLLTPHVRVIIRVQPYTPAVFMDVLAQIRRWADIGIHGITIEGMKYITKKAGLVKVAGDWCFPVKILRPQYEAIKAACHKNGIAFYCAENRLRALGDSLCCCGIEGLKGFVPNRANLNHLLYDPQGLTVTAGQATYPVKASVQQTSTEYKALMSMTYEEYMRMIATTNYKNILKPII